MTFSKFKKLNGMALIFILIMFNSFSQKYSENSQEFWQDFAAKEAVKYPVVFVHGIAGGFKNWEKTVKTVSGGKYFEIGYFEGGRLFHNYLMEKREKWFFNVSYYSPDLLNESLNGNLDIYAERLKNIVQLVRTITGAKKVVLISHSMGGLVARRYMTLDECCWESVNKILTVATPNEGVDITIPLGGQLTDLNSGSMFMDKLRKEWGKYYLKDGIKKWGVVGAVDTGENNRNGIDEYTTDSGGPGFIMLKSSIPYGEWREAVKQFDVPASNTQNFGFRIITNSSHDKVMESLAAYKGIEWAASDNISD